jgi:hypothetical protein
MSIRLSPLTACLISGVGERIKAVFIARLRYRIGIAVALANALVDTAPTFTAPCSMVLLN